MDIQYYASMGDTDSDSGVKTMSDEYISRADAVDTIKKNFKYLPGYMNATINYIKALPSADVEPVAYGRWVYVDDDDMRYDTYYCSECRNRITVDSHRRDDIGFTIDDMKRCNKCGARMDTQEDE